MEDQVSVGTFKQKSMEPNSSGGTNTDSIQKKKELIYIDSFPQCKDIKQNIYIPLRLTILNLFFIWVHKFHTKITKINTTHKIFNKL